jgi:hypothetical protein
MVDIGVALTWIAISAASAKGLSAFARATATTDADTESAYAAGNDALAHDGSYRRTASAGRRGDFR